MSKILLTGASGFLGNVVVNNLLKNHHGLTTIGTANTNDIYCDLATTIPTIKSTFDWIIHMAGKAHIMPRNTGEVEDFFRINLEGTKNLIKGIEQSGKFPKSIIFISTVAVYGIETGINIDENNSLNGKSPYALSKIKAEKFLKSWCSQHGVTLGVLRPSLIAGKNPPGNLGAMISGIKSGRYFRIGNGSARKSLLMAEDIAHIIPKVAEIGGTYNVCDNHHPSFSELGELIAEQLNNPPPKAIPYFAAKTLALIGDLVGDKFPINSSKLDKITKPLTFSNEKAKLKLGWEPLDVIQNFKIN